MGSPESMPNRSRARRFAVSALLLIMSAGTAMGSMPAGATSTPVASPVVEIEDPPLLNLDPSNFDEHSATIDNEWMPLQPGMRRVYTGFDVDDSGEQIPHVVVDTTTDLTKVINGVRTRISLEEDYSDEELTEKDIRFTAQDKDGNVWHFGELVETYDEGAYVGTQIWLGGLTEGAHVGISMLAAPQVGESYSQGYAPSPYFWTDRAIVHAMGEQTTVPAGSYDDVMVIAEWDKETEEGVFQDKYHAPGVGVVRVGFRGPDPLKEELELVGIEELNPIELSDIRAEILRMEERAYFYSQTPPAEPDNPDGSGVNTETWHQGLNSLPGRVAVRAVSPRTAPSSARPCDLGRAHLPTSSWRVQRITIAPGLTQRTGPTGKAGN